MTVAGLYPFSVTLSKYSIAPKNSAATMTSSTSLGLTITATMKTAAIATPTTMAVGRSRPVFPGPLAGRELELDPDRFGRPLRLGSLERPLRGTGRERPSVG